MTVQGDGDWYWMSQVQPLMREITSLIQRGGNVAALTLAVPERIADTHEDRLRNLLAREFTRLGQGTVDLTLVRNGGHLRIVSVEFEA